MWPAEIFWLFKINWFELVFANNIVNIDQILNIEYSREKVNKRSTVYGNDEILNMYVEEMTFIIFSLGKCWAIPIFVL